MKKVGKFAAALVVMAAAIGMMGCAQPSGGSTSGGGNDNPGTPQVVGPDYSTCVVGDFILKDGSILKNSDSLTLSDTQKSNVAAVIVRAKTDDKPALGVGIVHQTGLAWCKRYTDDTNSTEVVGYSTNITALQGTTTSGYTDGSNSWSLLNTAVSNDAINNPDNYPAWKFCKDYAIGKNFSDALATGWYLPTVAELKTIYDNNKNNAGVIEASLSKAGGNQFETDWYWSCCQCPSTNNLARVLSFTNGSMYSTNKDYSGYYVCSVRAFN